MEVGDDRPVVESVSGRSRPDGDKDMGALEVPTWATWREAWHVVLYQRHLSATTKIALVVGTVLFAINQLDVVVRGDASTSTWIKSAVTYLVPFAVSNLGILIATRRHP